MELNQILLVLGGIPMIICLFSTLLFTRTPMKYIERKLIADGKGKLAWGNDNWGHHISSLVTLVAREKPSKCPVLTDEGILQYVRPYDCILAKIVCYSFYLMMFFSAIIYFIDES